MVVVLLVGADQYSCVTDGIQARRPPVQSTTRTQMMATPIITTLHCSLPPVVMMSGNPLPVVVTSIRKLGLLGLGRLLL
jgi:hypothetical protein